MSIWNIGIQEIDTLWNILGSSGNGASVSYSRLVELGFTDRPEGFTTGFGTYANSCPNNGFYDPVQTPHVEIYFDGRYHMSDNMLTREERCMITDSSSDFPGYWSETSQMCGTPMACHQCEDSRSCHPSDFGRVNCDRYHCA